MHPLDLNLPSWRVCFTNRTVNAREVTTPWIKKEKNFLKWPFFFLNGFFLLMDENMAGLGKNTVYSDCFLSDGII